MRTHTPVKKAMDLRERLRARLLWITQQLAQSALRSDHAEWVKWANARQGELRTEIAKGDKRYNLGELV